ncbi:MAG: thioredoxin family protein [Planctomycetota bacterium]|nr:thioredoxin family protein [Planctomycetota bacterium]
MDYGTGILSVVVVLGMLFRGGTAEDKTTAPQWQTDVNHAWQTAQASRRPLILYFKMANCVFCRKMERETFADQALTADIREQFVAAHLTLEQHGDLVKRYQVRTFPTTVIISPDARVIDHIPGYIGPKDLRTRLRVAAETLRIAAEKSASQKK